ncbi:MAG: hypothetical protein ATN35_03435 [Epulopiscium sp. Nele67-Bin004]|nr:MAG: hypothetical protein ATN35_03435 [Epulopiscium sp. Nele67-Bin004]
MQDLIILATSLLLIGCSAPQVNNHFEPSYRAQQYITGDDAAQIAFTHANATPENISRLEIETETFNGRMIYEIEWTENGRKYEYNIDAATGSIYDFETEVNYTSK